MVVGVSDLGGGGVPSVGGMSRTCKATLRLFGSNQGVPVPGVRAKESQGSFAGSGHTRRGGGTRREVSEEFGWEEDKESPPLHPSPVVRGTTRARTATRCVEIGPGTSKIRSWLGTDSSKLG